MKYYYEVLWFLQVNEDGDPDGDYESRTFQTRKAALNYYEKHKNDEGCFGWWVTKRYADDDQVAEDIVW